MGGLFSGRIVTPDNEYYVERASRYFGNASAFHSIFYAAKDVAFSGAACGLHGAAKAWADDIQYRYASYRQQQQRAKRSVLEPVDTWEGVDSSKANGSSKLHRDREPTNMEGRKKSAHVPDAHLKRVCNLEIIIDQTLYEAKLNEYFVDVKVKQALMELVHSHVSSAREIFKHVNFSGITDISFEVQRTHINGSATCAGSARHSNPFCSPNLDATHVLHELSKQNHDDFCLTYLWTHRDFPEGTLGLAYMAEPEGNSGGICEKFLLGASVELASEYVGRLSLNTGIVTFINQNVQVPQRITEITFSHEMGHNFGSPHDFPAECTPANGDGKYIMYASATQGTLPNNRKFSPCSVRNISLVLEQVFMTDGHRTNCFQELRGPFCGNSIRDGDEECDCGYEPEDCQDSCCYSRGNAGKSCKLKSHAVCSPTNDACCTKNCAYRKASDVCRPSDDCSFEAYCEYPLECNGRSGACPPSEHRDNMTACNSGTQLCSAGKCTHSICLKYGLKGCTLTGSARTPDEMCLIACKDSVDGECKEACQFDVMKALCSRRMEPGAACDELRGYCDVFRKCRPIDAEGALSRLQQIVFRGYGNALVTYWPLTLLATALGILMMGLFIRVCTAHTPSNNPTLVLNKSFNESFLHPLDFLKDSFKPLPDLS